MVNLVEIWRRKPNSDGERLPFALALLSRNLLMKSRNAEAETAAREAMIIYQKTLSDQWVRFESESLLGNSLVGQKKYEAAEPLLLSGYEGLKAREATLRLWQKPRVSQAGERIVQLYDAWGKSEKAALWKTRLGLAELPEDVFARN